MIPLILCVSASLRLCVEIQTTYTMTLANAQHEAFAQARFAGQTQLEAYQAAGFGTSDSCKVAASRLARQPDIQERIAELYRERAAESVYDKAGAVRDLLSIIHTAPSDVDGDHPLCEVRMGKDGTCHRFPPKLQAMARLIKLMGWDAPPPPSAAESESGEERPDTLRDWIVAIRSGRLKNLPKEEAGSQDKPANDIESQIAFIRRRIYGPEANSNPTIAINGKPSPNTASALSPKQEAFAIARANGLGVMAAYHAAGYEGGSANLAWRLNHIPAVRARIAELNGTVETITGYGKDDAVRDLVAIIHARPSEAGPDHPLCERRLTSWGEYHRFPSKLAALTLLARLCHWNHSKAREAQDAVPYHPDENLRQYLHRVRQKQEAEALKHQEQRNAKPRSH
jgi:hypothetical protein